MVCATGKGRPGCPAAIDCDAPAQCGDGPPNSSYWLRNPEQQFNTDWKLFTDRVACHLHARLATWRDRRE